MDWLEASGQSVQEARPHVIVVLKLLGWTKPLLLHSVCCKTPCSPT